MLKGFSNRLARFITDHIMWEFLDRLLATQWTYGLTFILAVAVTVIGWMRKQPLYVTAPAGVVLFLLAAFALFVSLSLKQKGLSEIRFDYLPERSPEERGWELVMDQGTIRPTFSLGDTLDADKCLYLGGAGYRLDYRLELHESLCRAVGYSAKLKDPDTSVVYAQVRMTSKDGNGDKDGWIGHKFDTTAGSKKLDAGEWTLTDPGKPLTKTGWRSFRWSLQEEVERTFGADGGWVYKRLLRIRLRGTLSI
jgi:hypothetical protein